MKRRRALPYCLRMIFRKTGAHFSGSRSDACGESWPLDRVVCSAGGIVAQQEALDDAGAWFRRRLGKSGKPAATRGRERAALPQSGAPTARASKLSLISIKQPQSQRHKADRIHTDGGCDV